MEPRANPKQIEKDKFVRSVVDQIKEGKKSNAFDQLILIAAPNVLGKLRKSLSGSLSDCVVGEIAKDLTNLNVKDLGGHLGDIRL